MFCVESKAVGVSVNVRKRVAGRVCEREEETVIPRNFILGWESKGGYGIRDLFVRTNLIQMRGLYHSSHVC
jgi:hypothetical protein